MHFTLRLPFVLALILAALGIASFLTLNALWVSAVAYADTQLCPVGEIGSYVPPPGPIYLENDSYYWLGYAQRIARGETWRIRDTKIDNFPAGREVHWSQSVSWSMVMFGRIRAVFTGEILATAIEKASTAINPLLFAFATTCLFAALASRLGVVPAALFTAFLGSVGDVGWVFHGLRPGHQGFHIVFGGVSVIGLILGGMGLTARQESVGAPWMLYRPSGLVGPRAARRWFTGAGIAAGLALWVSATIESFFIYPMVFAFLMLLVLVPARTVHVENLIVQPDLWRRWGLTAGGVGFLFYLIEYFPHRMAMRIEVNHPVYDLGVVGVGEALRLMSLWRWGNGQFSSRQKFTLAGWLILAALPVLLIARGPIAWHSMRDPQMLRMHNFIQEFYTYNNFIKTDGLTHFFRIYGLLPVASWLTPFFLLRRNLTVAQIVWLWCTFVFACSFFIVGYLQVRWLGFYASAVCLSSLMSLHFAFGLLPEMHFARRPLVVMGILVLLLIQPVEHYRRQMQALVDDLHGLSVEEQVITPLINKRVAVALKASPQHPKAVITEGGFAPSLEYFSGIPSLQSFYWENVTGLHETTRFFAATDPVVAHEVAIRTGATHVIIPPGTMLPNTYYFIAHGYYNEEDAKNTFLAKLLDGKAPMWIQPDMVLNFITNQTYAYRGKPITTHLETFRIEN